MRAYVLGIALVWTALGGVTSACSSRGTRSAPGATGPTLTLFALGEMRGQIEPCGCTTDPLGDLARTVALVEAARAGGPVVVVDAGSLLYTQATLADHVKAQEELKADLLASVYRDQLAVAAIGLGPNDLAAGPGGLRLPRQVANLPADTSIAVDPPRLIAIGDQQVGVFGVVEPDRVPELHATDPVAAARAAVESLRGRGATRVIALVNASRKTAVGLARAVDGIDVMVVGLGLQAPEPAEVRAVPEQVGSTWIVFPANRGQVISRFAITLRPGGGPLVDAIGEASAADRRAELTARIEQLDAELRGFAADPNADPAFVAQRQGERDQLAAERDELATRATRIPATGSYFELAQIRIARALACDTSVVAAKQEYARAAGQANVAAARTRPAPPVPAGTPTYVGVEACSDCHDEQVAFWKQTKHASAWHTLEELGKQFDYDCIGCHTTGYDQPGGATMAVNETLRDVQCETCHGPGSAHVEADDDEAFERTIQRDPPADLCAGLCHTPDHSDTFEPQAYLRDIVGPGHGGRRRKKLGDGPTGHELRAAGLARAGKELGAGCPK